MKNYKSNVEKENLLMPVESKEAQSLCVQLPTKEKFAIFFPFDEKETFSIQET